MPIRPGSSLPLPPTLPTVHLACDHDEGAVSARRRTGAWERIGRGAYLAKEPDLTPRRRALARIVAVEHQLRTPHWFSHESAALVWGLPLWREGQQVQVRQPGRPSAKRDRTVSRHRGPVDAMHLTVVSGLPVTDLEQTMVDCARTLPPLSGLVVADGALRAGADRAAALALLDDLAGRGGVTRARAVMQLADGGSESPGETATRFVLLRAGLPCPQTQIEVDTSLGTFWGDLGWPEWKILVEYDGRTKYAGVDDLIREKRRNDALVEAGWRVLHVTKEDLRSPAALVARVERLLPADAPRITRRALRA